MNTSMIIVDFDDTLFNTHAHKHARLKALKPYGIDEECYWRTYALARSDDQGISTYSNMRHAQMLAQAGFDSPDILAVLEQTTSDEMLAQYRFADTIPFLYSLKSFADTMILLSLGEPSFQELKTRGSGVHDFFDRVFMVDDTKRHVLSELFKHSDQAHAWFVNDKIKETQELTELFPDMRVVLKKSEKFDKQEYQESAFTYFYTLTEIAEYVIAS